LILGVMMLNQPSAPPPEPERRAPMGAVAISLLAALSGGVRLRLALAASAALLAAVAVLLPPRDKGEE
jgi:hypothetical protein